MVVVDVIVVMIDVHSGGVHVSVAGDGVDGYVIGVGVSVDTAIVDISDVIGVCAMSVGNVAVVGCGSVRVGDGGVVDDGAVGVCVIGSDIGVGVGGDNVVGGCVCVVVYCV